MTVAILGTGNMGKGLASRLKGKVDVVFGSREPGKAVLGLPVLSYAEAAAKADIVVLAIPYFPALEILKGLDLAGKTLVDFTNPLNADFATLAVNGNTSGAEEIQKQVPTAHVVKAFNTVFAALFEADTSKVQVFIAGNDKAANAKVADLVTKAGFVADDVGTLDQARTLEPLGLLNIHLGYHLGRGTRIAPVFVSF